MTVVLSTLFLESAIALLAIGGAQQPQSAFVQKQVQEVPQKEKEPEIIISQYDSIIREVAQNEGFDWRLLSAIAYAESNFRSDVRSRVGAVGLMQIMPFNIRSAGYTIEQALDPKINLELAVMVIRSIENSLRLDGVGELERTKIILAGYNSGIGNLINSRKEAHLAGVNYNNWDQLKEFGRVNNTETRNFVHKVIKQWDYYREIA